ncbi:uncharacterized protein LY89DRAFT_704673, partial [Mollisia scopiformis]
MADPPLPRIKVTDAQFPEGSATGTSGLESPSTTTDGGQSARPRSATSSEGNAQSNGKKSPIKIIRNNTTTIKEVNGSKPTSPSAAVQPSTAIDPLSHVRTASILPYIAIGTPEIPDESLKDR